MASRSIVLLALFLSVGLVANATDRLQQDYLKDEIGDNYSWYAQTACNPSNLVEGVNDWYLQHVDDSVFLNNEQLGLYQSTMDAIVEELNDFREQAAEGELTDTSGNKLPAASNMAKIRRSADLECNSLRWMYVTRAFSAFVGGVYMLPNSLADKNLMTKFFEFNSEFNSATRTWPDREAVADFIDLLIQHHEINSGDIDKNYGLEDSTYFLQATATRVGCSQISGGLHAGTPYRVSDAEAGAKTYGYQYVQCLFANEENYSVKLSTHLYLHDVDQSCNSYKAMIPDHSTRGEDISGADYPQLCYHDDDNDDSTGGDDQSSSSSSSSSSSDWSSDSYSSSSSSSSEDTGNDSQGGDDTTGGNDSSASISADENQLDYLQREIDLQADAFFADKVCDPSDLKAMWSAEMLENYNAALAANPHYDVDQFKIGFTYQESVEYTDKHNYYREQASIGAQDGALETLWSAKNNALVRREPLLECGSASWLLYMVVVEKGMDHSSSNMRQNAGENLSWAATSATTADSLAGKDAVASWHSELEDVDNNDLEDFGSSTHYIGHYTPIVWGSVTRVGCSRILINKDNSVAKSNGMVWSENFTACQYAGESDVRYSSPNYTHQTVYNFDKGTTSYDSSWQCDNVDTPRFTQRGYDSRYPHLCGNPNLEIEKVSA